MAPLRQSGQGGSSFFPPRLLPPPQQGLPVCERVAKADTVTGDGRPQFPGAEETEEGINPLPVPFVLMGPCPPPLPLEQQGKLLPPK